MDKIILRLAMAKIQILGLTEAKITIWEKALWAQECSGLHEMF